MKSPLFLGAISMAIMGLGLSGPAEAQQHRRPAHHHHRHARASEGKCLRFNKTTGAVAGAVGGGVLGNAIVGGTGGTLVGAAAGGVAGHELATNRRKRCK
jgi:uncharacterized protein YcfJ